MDLCAELQACKDPWDGPGGAWTAFDFEQRPRRLGPEQCDFDRRCTSTTAIYVQRGRYGRLAETPRHDIASAARARRTMAEVQSSSRSQQAYAIGAV